MGFVSSLLPSPKRPLPHSQLWYLLCNPEQVTETLDFGLRPSLRLIRLRSKWFQVHPPTHTHPKESRSAVSRETSGETPEGPPERTLGGGGQWGRRERDPRALRRDSKLPASWDLGRSSHRRELGLHPGVAGSPATSCKDVRGKGTQGRVRHEGFQEEGTSR